jgi:LysR family transcriptional regulator, chromosome initiation inhibitor
MKIDSAQLVTFEAVVAEGSFDAAARRLHVTPSAVSQRIKGLEQQLGQVLVRRARPVRPTEAGQALVRLAGQVALLESEALAELRGGSVRPQLRMPIAVNADSLASWFLPALAALDVEQQVLFDVHQEDEEYSAALLRDGSVMAAVTADPMPVQGCAAQRLGSLRYLAMAAPAYVERWFPDGPTPDALAQAPVVVFNRKDALQHQLLRRLSRRKLSPPAHYIPSSTAHADGVRLGLGWGMVPEQDARPDSDAGRLVDIAPGKHLDVALYWQHWKLDSPVLRSLTETVHAAAAASLR